MKITFDEYDKMIEDFDNIDTPTMWPTLEQIDEFEKEPDKWLPFCVYLLEKGSSPTNKEEEYSKRTLNKFVNNYLELYDNEEVSENE